MESKEIITSRGHRITGHIYGKGADVLLIHGIPGSAGVWGSVAAELAVTHRVIVPDLLGFGASSRPTGIEDLWAGNQADTIVELLDAIETDRIHVVGHDFGGLVAAALFERIPDSFISLTLAATNVFSDTPVPFPLSGVLMPGLGSVWARLLFSRPSLKMMVKLGMGRPLPEHLELAHYLGDHEQIRSIRTIFTTALKQLADRYEPVTKSLENCSVPSAVLWGDQDPFFPVEQGRKTAELLGTNRFISLPGAGHFLPEERPETIIETVRNIGSD